MPLFQKKNKQNNGKSRIWFFFVSLFVFITTFLTFVASNITLKIKTPVLTNLVKSTQKSLTISGASVNPIKSIISPTILIYNPIVSTPKNKWVQNTLEVLKNLKDNFKYDQEVSNFLKKYPISKILQIYKSTNISFAQQVDSDLEELLEKINGLKTFDTSGREITYAKPSRVFNLSTGTSHKPNKFVITIAKLPLNQRKILQLTFHVNLKITPSQTINYFDLIIKNENLQLKDESINNSSIANQRNIFIRYNRNLLHSQNGVLVAPSVNLFEFKKVSGHLLIKLHLTNELNSLKLVDNANFTQRYKSYQYGFLEIEKNNTSSNEVHLFSTHLNLRKTSASLDMEPYHKEFKLFFYKEAKIAIPVWYLDNKLGKQILIINFINDLTISPDNFNIEKGVFDTTKSAPFELKTKVEDNRAEVKFNFGNNLWFTNDHNQSTFDLTNFGRSAMTEKIFFEKIDVTSPEISKQVTLTKFIDKNSEVRRILADRFANWMGLKPSLDATTTNTLNFKTYIITHEQDYSNIKIANNYKLNRNLTGKEIYNLFTISHKRKNTILKKYLGNEFKPTYSNDFYTAININEVKQKMGIWFYSKIGSNELNTLFEQVNRNRTNYTLIEKVLVKLVEAAEENALEDFRFQILSKWFVEIATALTKTATDEIMVLPKDLFRNITHVNVKNVLEKANFVRVITKTKTNLGKQILSSIFYVIKEFGLTSFIFANDDSRNTFVSLYAHLTNPYIFEEKNNFDKANKIFRVYLDLFRYLEIDVDDLVSSTTKAGISKNTIANLFIKNIKKTTTNFLTKDRYIDFFGKSFKVSKLDALLVSRNTQVVMQHLRKTSIDFEVKEKLDLILNSNLASGISIGKFAVSLNQPNIRKYISYFSNQPKEHIEKLLKIHVKNLDYNLAKPVTPGLFGKFLMQSKTIFASVLLIISLILALLGIVLAIKVEKNKYYSYQKWIVYSRVQNLKLIHKLNHLTQIFGIILFVIAMIILLISIFIFANIIILPIFIL